jgi:cobalamin-dependent methionine synthase I
MGVAIKLAGQGFRVMWLGADVPTPELLEIVRARRPALVCLSAVFERSSEELLAFAQQISGLVPASTRVLIGGRATYGLRGRSVGRVLIGAELSDLDPNSVFG